MGRVGQEGKSRLLFRFLYMNLPLWQNLFVLKKIALFGSMKLKVHVGMVLSEVKFHMALLINLLNYCESNVVLLHPELVNLRHNYRPALFLIRISA